MQIVIIASAGLLLAVIPLAREALTDPVNIGIAAVCLVPPPPVTELDTLWLILVAGVIFRPRRG